MKNIEIILISLAFVITLTNCSTKVTRESTYSESSKGGNNISTVSKDDEIIAKKKTEWENEFITSFGQAPVVKKYKESSRNIMLAKRGALLDAERNLAEKISKLELTATTTMADYATTDFVQSRISTDLNYIEILNERYDEGNDIYEVQIRMPKLKVLRILEEYKLNN